MKNVLLAIGLIFCSSAYADFYYCIAAHPTQRVIYLSPVHFSRRTSIEQEDFFVKILKSYGFEYGAAFCMTDYGGGYIKQDLEKRTTEIQNNGFAIIPITVY